MAKIEEGRQFDCMFQIWNTGCQGSWTALVKEPDPDSYREYIKTMVADVKESLEQKDMKFTYHKH